MAAQSVPVVGTGAAVASAQIDTYRGFTLRETSGSASATVRVFDGGTEGVILDTVQLAARESAREWYGHADDEGLSCKGDLYVEIVAGAVEGSLRYS